MAIYYSNKFDGVNIDANITCAYGENHKNENGEVDGNAVIVIEWQADKIGFGQYSIVVKNGRLYIDDECMESENFPFLGALLQSILDKQNM